jgi:hypothetical protein
VLLILILTLTPSQPGTATSGLCLICGERGLADAILNVLFFIPLGLLTRAGFGAWAPAVITCALLSAGIESIQVFLPGRDGSAGDLLFNAVGGMVGVAIVARARRSRESGAGVAPGVARALTFVSGLTLGLTGWALAPNLEPGEYVSMWIPELGHLAPIDAHIEEVRLAGFHVRNGRLSDPEVIRARLTRGSPLVIVVDSSEPARGVGGLFAIYDDRRREVVLLGRHGDDLVYRVERRASSLRLDVPDIRVQGLFPRGGSDRLRIRVERDPDERGGVCLTWGAPEGGETRHCGLGLTLGRGWALLFYPEGLGATARGMLDIGWVFLLLAPTGLWVRRHRETASVGAAAVALMITIPVLTDLLTTPPHLYGAGAAGLGAGMLFARMRLRDTARIRPRSRTPA